MKSLAECYQFVMDKDVSSEIVKGDTVIVEPCVSVEDGKYVAVLGPTGVRVFRVDSGMTLADDEEIVGRVREVWHPIPTRTPEETAALFARVKEDASLQQVASSVKAIS